MLDDELIPKIKDFLSKRGLKVSEVKSKIINLRQENFDFLGFNIGLKQRDFRINQPSDKSTVLIIKPTIKSIKKVKAKLKDVFSNQETSLLHLIKKVNPILRGWANYYRVSHHSQKEFIKIHNYVYGLTIN
jgi:RNA-directed DNA polymerase